MEKSEIREILWQLDQARKQLLQPYFLEIGLTLGQGQPRILKTLLLHGTMTQRELADRCRLDVTTMSRVLDRMQDAGFLKREQNPECRRSYQIVLTEEGRKKAEQVIKGFSYVDDCLWNGFSEVEMEVVVNGLKKMLRNVNEKGTDGARQAD